MTASATGQGNEVPYVSIIIPAYNAEQTVKRCLQSVREQSYGNWECIVVNDGSRDHTGEIVEGFEKADKRIRQVKQANAGVSAARNRGMALAAGTLITFLDADDYWETVYLEKLVALQRQYHTDLTMCEFTNLSSKGNRRERRSILEADCHAEGDAVFSAFFPIFLWNGKKQRPGGPVCKLYKRQIIQEHLLRFPEDVHYNEDFLFNIWYFQYVSSFFYLHESLYNRLLHGTSAVHRYQEDIYQEIEKMFVYYQLLREKFQWKCPRERMFFLHLMTDLPFNMNICRPENPQSDQEKKREYFSFLCRESIQKEWKKIRLKDCVGLKSKGKYLLLRSKQFFLLKFMYTKS